MTSKINLDLRIRNAINASCLLWHSGACTERQCMCRLEQRKRDLEERLSVIIRRIKAEHAQEKARTT